MRSSHTTRDHDLGAWLLLLSAFVSTFAAAALGWLLRGSVLKYSRSPSLALVFSILYVVSIVAIAGSIAETEIRFVKGFSKTSKRTLLLTLLCGSPWLGPVIILCSIGHIPMVISLGALAFFEGKLLGQFGELLSLISEAPSKFRGRGTLVGFIESSSGTTQQFNLTIAICLAYLGIFAVVSQGEAALAAALISSSAFFVGWIKQDLTLVDKQTTSTVARRWCSQTVWAIFVTLLTLLPHAGNFDPSYRTGRLLRQKEDSNLGKLQSGVILFVKRKPLIPLRIAPGEKVYSSAVPRTLSIPFSGEYWFFPRPRSPIPGNDWFFERIHKRPPASSLRKEGDPTNISVTLEDVDEMIVQARQHIGLSAELSSWRFIDVVLDGEDQQPQDVMIELLAADASPTGDQIQTLGVKSMTNPITVSTSSSGKMSSFRFSVPPTSDIRSFNQLWVWFHLKAPRMQKGITVKIDRFDLIP